MGGFFPVAVLFFFDAGSSKLSWRQLLASPRHLWHLWQNSQACRHAGISGSPASPSKLLTRTAVNVFSLMGAPPFMCVRVLVTFMPTNHQKINKNMSHGDASGHSRLIVPDLLRTSVSVPK